MFLLNLLPTYSGICSNEINDPVRDKLENFFSPLSKAYMEICEKQTREFFGLRDFYRYNNNFVSYVLYLGTKT